MTNEKELRQEYPLHWAVFRNDYEDLMELLEEEHASEILDKLDVRGRTPLMLAITLGHYECARALLEKGANASIQNADGLLVSPIPLRISLIPRPSLMQICGRRVMKLYVLEIVTFTTCYPIPRLSTSFANKLCNGTFAYSVEEMSWEFTSWLPFVSKMCPSDTYKIYKRGSNVRIDTTLVGFDITSNWKRGNQSFIFRYSDNRQAQLIVLDHESKTAIVHTMNSQATNDLKDFIPPEEAIYSRMTSPVDTTFIDVEKIGFERSKGGGLLSWLTSSDRVEEVEGYECKVFNASNVDIVTKTRTEHLLEEDKEKFRREERENPLHTILKLAERHQKCTSEMKQTGSNVYCGLTPQQYLDKNYSMNNRDIGLPKQVTKKTSSFKATLWLCDHYPLDLQDQILPIIDLMAVNNAHFARLKNFIQLQLPAGFPIDVNPAAFEIPPGYRSLDNGDYSLCMSGNIRNVHEMGSSGNLASRRYVSEDELYLQFALEQSIRETVSPPAPVSNANTFVAASVSNVLDWHADKDLVYAIEESMRTLRLEQLMREESTTTIDDPISTEPQTAMDDDLQLAIWLSRKEEEERLKACKEQEQELERIMELSLIDK
ncbi:hypothetical protein DINM_002420 [Dirofilaria immitis]|nr:hypothetical protein [Dirofilaria immitis]